LLLPDQWVAAIWHGEQRGLVALAFAAAFMQNSLWPVLQQAGESQRQTLRVQSISAVIIALHLLAMALLWISGHLGLYAIFIAIICEYLLAGLAVHRLLRYPAPGGTADGPQEPVFGDYLRYCLPLVPYAWMTFAYEFADRWLLQHYGGNVQQAYYTVGAQFAAVALIATTSILNIFWKEIAEAHHRRDFLRMGAIYQKVSRVLFFTGAAIAGYFLPWTQELLHLFLGAAYAGGAATLAIMFLYPVHQSMGQIGSTLLYATEKARIQVFVTVVFMLASIATSYLLLAPPDAAIPGQGLGSQGLALKMVVLQLINVNVTAYIIARIWKWKFHWLYQAVALLGCVGLGWLARAAGTLAVPGSWPVLAAMALAAAFYLALIALFVYSVPALLGMTRNEVLWDATRLLRGIAILRRRHPS